MSENFLSTLSVIVQELNGPKRNRAKLGALARSIRWHRTMDTADWRALLEVGELIQHKKGPGVWDVERTILEIMCEHAKFKHTAYLIDAFQRSGKHGNDRRRLALQALSTVAARTRNNEALQMLEKAMWHHRKDTRGWAIGFLQEVYRSFAEPLPESVIDRLEFMIDHDRSADVRVEAVRVLADEGLADSAFVDAVIGAAVAQRNRNKV